MTKINEHIGYQELVQRKLEIIGWSRPNDHNEMDVMQQSVQDNVGNTGILLSVDDVPYLFLRVIDNPIIDPFEIYQGLLLGWNLNAWITIMPGPSDSLRFFGLEFERVDYNYAGTF